MEYTTNPNYSQYRLYNEEFRLSIYATVDGPRTRYLYWVGHDKFCIARLGLKDDQNSHVNSGYLSSLAALCKIISFLVCVQ